MLDWSDHTPVYCALRKRNPLPTKSRPLPQWVAEASECKAFVDDYQSRLLRLDMPTLQQWLVHKQIIVQAAKEARDKITTIEPLGPRARRFNLTSAARACLRGDANIVEQIIAKHE